MAPVATATGVAPAFNRVVRRVADDGTFAGDSVDAMFSRLARTDRCGSPVAERAHGNFRIEVLELDAPSTKFPVSSPTPTSSRARRLEGSRIGHQVLDAASRRLDLLRQVRHVAPARRRRASAVVRRMSPNVQSARPAN
jgi:hypothetical protein